ncbi:uncharacterized protein LOC110814181 isoform X2 [Carica papaya]|uniref:uncharacterized protein LOC110814181 isoform X2 n=1 Tax=Carica papaya TaxID=3649 RepID=UPI000B8C8D71|nr:uncharacterized protein LOC110814181 isoform X2 [Carica papaya]
MHPYCYHRRRSRKLIPKSSCQKMASSVSVSVNLYYILAHKSAALVGRLPKRRTLSHLVGLKSVKFSHRNTGICFTTDAFVVADDAKYGNKQVISLTPRLYDYVIANVREPEILRQLREETASMCGSQMQTFFGYRHPLIRHNCLQCLYRF